MKAYILSDGEFATQRLARLEALIAETLSERGMAITKRQIQPQELQHCKGCFGCWIKTPGECVIRDAIGEINRETVNSDVVIYLCPVVFGQCSANMKDVFDRWIPNILPFFKVREGGHTTHPARYKTNPQYVMIGYGDGLTDEDAELFRSITQQHRRNGAVIVDRGDDQQFTDDFASLELKRMGDEL